MCDLQVISPATLRQVHIPSFETTFLLLLTKSNLISMLRRKISITIFFQDEHLKNSLRSSPTTVQEKTGSNPENRLGFALVLASALAALLGTAETVLGSIWMWLIHNEIPTIRTMTGGLIVLTALLSHIGWSIYCQKSTIVNKTPI